MYTRLHARHGRATVPQYFFPGRLITEFARIIFWLLVLSTTGHSQWHRATGNFTGSTSYPTGVFDIDVYARDPDTVYALSDWFLRSTSQGRYWDTLPGSALARLNGQVRVDPLNSNIVYAAFDRMNPSDHELNAVYETRDGGQHWTLQFQAYDFWPTTVLTVDPSDHKTVYSSIASGWLKRTTDEGLTWQDVSIDSFASGQTSLVISSMNDSILYAASYGTIVKSTDKGKSWTWVSIGPTLFAERHLAIDPRDPNVVYLTVTTYGSTDSSGGAFKSTDGAASWEAINNGLPNQDHAIYDIVLNPKDPEEILLATNSYASGDKGVFRSTNGGALWQPFGDGLPDTIQVFSLAIDTLNRRIYAGVYAQGGDVAVYAYDGILAVDSEKEGLPTTYSLSQNYPNPFNPSTRIEYVIGSPGFVSLKIYNIAGCEVATLVQRNLHAGAYSVEWNAAGLPSGVYFCRLAERSSSVTKKLTLIK